MARKWTDIKADRADIEYLEKARERVKLMQSYDLLEWADVAGSGMSKGFMDYRRHSYVESLREIRSTLMQLVALTDELIERKERGA